MTNTNIVREVSYPDSRCNATTNARVYLAENLKLDLLWLDLGETLQLADNSINIIRSRVRTPNTSEINQKSTVLQRHHHMSTERLGECTGAKALLILRSCATPVRSPKRPVPYAPFPVVEQKLKRLRKMAVIEPVKFSDRPVSIVLAERLNCSGLLQRDKLSSRNSTVSPYFYLKIFLPNRTVEHFLQNRTFQTRIYKFWYLMSVKISSRSIHTRTYSNITDYPLQSRWHPLYSSK